MILSKVNNTIKRYRLIRKNDKVVVGVSGGPDSVAMLYLLCALKKKLNLSLHIAHLNHMMREDSDRDQKFVETLAKRLALPITTAQVDIKKIAIAQRGGSLEGIARNARLGFLFRVAKEIKSDKIALGHNFDDQAETVIMRILRGTGLYGLSAILPRRVIGGYQVIRPLIEIRRRDIEAYLRKKRIKPRLDKSNLKDIYFRNKIRNKLLPLLEKEYNKNIKTVLSNMAESAAYDYDYLMRKANAVMKKLGRRINLEKFRRLHPAIQRLVLRLAITKLKGDTRRINFQHVRELEDLILNRPINSIVDLPKGVSVSKKKRHLVFYLR